jgi:hypothetical protein
LEAIEMPKHYNPADDPSVVGGIQKAHGFKAGDIVEYTNPNGITFGPHVVVGFAQDPNSDRTVYIDSDSPWFAVKPRSLNKIGQKRKMPKKRAKAGKCPNRGGNCEHTMDCMWGIDGWCGRPEGWGCVLAKTG